MTDLEIIKRIRAGNIKAYAELIERYQSAVYASARRCTEDEGVMEITACSFVRAFSFLGNVNVEADYAVYLFRCLIAQLQESSRIQKNADVIYLYEHIQQLDVHLRTVLVLRYVMGLSYEQMMEKTRYDLSAIMSSLSEARQKILNCSGCDAYQLKLQAYIDNEMMRMDRMDVEVHAESCTACAHFVERAEEIFGESLYLEMPQSVVSAVMEQVTEEYVQEEDASDRREELSSKLKKNKNLRLWVLVVCVILFGMFSWLFSLVAENNLRNISSSDSSESSVITKDSYSKELANLIKKADAVFVEFGFHRVGVTEEAMIFMFADYIAEQPAQEYQGAAASGSLGKITTEPSLGYEITITSEHRLLINDGKKIWELQTTRDKLLDTLKALGI